MWYGLSHALRRLVVLPFQPRFCQVRLRDVHQNSSVCSFASKLLTQNWAVVADKSMDARFGQQREISRQQGHPLEHWGYDVEAEHEELINKMKSKDPQQECFV